MYKTIIDGNEAAANIAYKLSEFLPIYPITPSSPMAEYCTQKNAKGDKNLFGEDVKITQMQSEAGVAGALHGALLVHSFASTFTSSQGLLLMIPNMYKLSGECLPAVIHVSARSVASHALSIFCDHSDVMATRMCGFLMLASSSVQECHDMALAAHTLAMKNSLPVLHFFDGFRTSHQLQKIDMFEDDEIRFVIKNYFVTFKDNFKIRQYGTAQNPDVFFQNREANQNKYDSVKKNLKEIFIDIEKISGRHYDFFEYYGAKDAEEIVVAMASASQTLEQYIDENKDKKIGLIKVRLYRPFEIDEFLAKLPKTVKKITVLDRTKENGAIAPLALDVISALSKSERKIECFYGRYGLGGKDFDLDDANAVFVNMHLENPKNNFTVGINDDKNHSSLDKHHFEDKSDDLEIKIFGLGSDGSVSASKSTIKILGENYDKNVQGYFEYDSKKSGSLTISHLRLSDRLIKKEYLLKSSNIISINNYSFVTRYDCLKGLKNNGIVLLNTIFNNEEIGKVLPKEYVEKIKATSSKLFVINGQKIASQCELGSKINLIMQAALFKCANLLSEENIIKEISAYIEDKLSIKGQDVVQKNLKSIKLALDSVQLVDNNSLVGKSYNKYDISDDKFYQEVMKKINNLEGDEIPVSKFEEDGSAPLATSRYEKRGIASRLPKWIKENCIQCGQCVLACPHSALSTILADKNIEDVDSFTKAIGLGEKLFKISLSPLDCTGCGVCASTCPAIKKALVMHDASEILEDKKQEYKKDVRVENQKQSLFSPLTAKGLQFNKSLFEFPGACAGCGQTPYLKILTMLNGSNMMIANATGCTSIYSGTYASCPYNVDDKGNGIFWANSLFEDNAEFGLGLYEGIKNNKACQGKKVWIVGGDGWAYDIGFGGLDHILASGENVNFLVLDNQTYSNTGGQQSKATPLGASVKFAENGKVLRKKNLGQIALCYKDVFVAQIALGANFNQAIKAISDAQEYNGVSIVIAYSPCVNQGFDLENMIDETKKAVECGFWPIYSFNPNDGKLVLNSPLNEKDYFDFLKRERRFSLTKENGKSELLNEQKKQAIEDYNFLKSASENQNNDK